MRIEIDGRKITAADGTTLLGAWLAAGHPLVDHVGCMGQGVCGACRVLVRRAGQDEATTELACVTRAEDGLQAAFLDDTTPHRAHPYHLDPTHDSWDAHGRVTEVFPEAPSCRHCDGCNNACPVDLEVHEGVVAAVAGDLVAAAGRFEDCVMCDLCTTACPEHIAPNHLGLFLRRMTTSLSLRPDDLLRRLHEIERGHMTIDVHASVEERG
ncbi:MAG: (2Fe-2S)-binding protein [Acidimicrobiia bacterium]|nr:(2Fe-2S)-binding protein [Acidimicrobiia bacterium]